ncbi:pyroglutamyl-peptidase [Chitinivorax tropicus]|uniref:Pyrrolidone-carboxylate peptidase n=1 Tax=Chitinivorax tropicus TaxID=714531 RepID=A0A840MMJ0_9PROT|nr:pyroglutamyl-peptidase I [Chitinivorax tropicus]MBB5020364.1 pyroglutamyl-peptidase [Chitinivorax tropicus]
MEKVLLTGFEPFDGERLNPSWEAVRQLQGHVLSDGSQIFTIQLPCVFDIARQNMTDALDSLQPWMVLAVGQAGGRAELSFERVAINLDDARIPDNAGQQPIDRPVIPNGPAAWFTTLPVKSIVLALQEAGIPAGISHSAGTYVCNHVFYGLMHQASRRPSLAKAGFVHIPYLPEQAARQPKPQPSMPLAQMVSGLELALETAVNTRVDCKISAGSTH